MGLEEEKEEFLVIVTGQVGTVDSKQSEAADSHLEGILFFQMSPSTNNNIDFTILPLFYL